MIKPKHSGGINNRSWSLCQREPWISLKRL